MHSRLELLFICPDAVKARHLCEMAEREVKSQSAEFDRHDPDSPTAMLNASEGRVSVGEDLFFALELCEKFRSLTGGYFDIAALSPDRSRPAYELFPGTHEAAMAGKGHLVDFGGFAKGFALESVRNIFSAEGITDGLLNFGNSSVVGMGKHPFGPCWRVRSEEGGRSFDLVDSAFSLSGRSRSGKDHIIDPHRQGPASAGPWVAVTGRSALVCEILSTALYAAPAAGRDIILKSFEGYIATYGS